MRTLILTAWLLLPLAALAYHYGPGQRHLLLDDVDRLLRSAEAHAEAGLAEEAIQAYRKALELMPEEVVRQRRRAQLELAKLEMNSRMLADAYIELTALVDELKDDAAADPELTRDAQASLANAKYYLTWLLRLEGAPREVWEPEIEAARQTFRELAEEAEETTRILAIDTADGATAGTTDASIIAVAASTAKSDQDATAKRHREDLEAVIRLARMDLDELQGLPLPSQCRGCCSGKCKGNKKGKKPGKSEGGERTEDARGASAGPPPDDAGS